LFKTEPPIHQRVLVEPLVFPGVFCAIAFLFFYQVSEFVIAKEVLPCKACQKRKSNFAFEVSAYNGEQQVGDQGAPDLYFIAFSLSPKKYFSGKFCLSCLNKSSICQRIL